MKIRDGFGRVALRHRLGDVRKLGPVALLLFGTSQLIAV